MRFSRLRNCFPLTDWLTQPVKAADDLIQYYYDVILMCNTIFQIMTSWTIWFSRLCNRFLLTDWLTHPVEAADDFIKYYYDVMGNTISQIT